MIGKGGPEWESRTALIVYFKGASVTYSLPL